MAARLDSDDASSNAQARQPMTVPAAKPTRKLRILHTVRSLRVDGVVKVILRNLTQRDRQRFEHYVCALLPDVDLVDECRAAGIEPIILGYTGPASAPSAVWRLAALIRRLQIDLVHANRTLDLTLAGSAARLSGVPVISSLHWLGRIEDHPEEDGRMPWWRRWLEMKTTVLLNRMLAQRIVAVSGAVRASYAPMWAFPAERVDVVYPGIDMQPTSVAPDAGDALRRDLGINDAAPILLNVGRLHPVKGQRRLLRLMKTVRERHPHATLLIAGEGELRVELSARIADEGLHGAIRLLGQRADIDALLAISDVLVLSSESEAAPLPLLEAMRAGKPVVATAVGGVVEMVEPGVTGVIVERGNDEALAEAVLHLLDRPAELQRMGLAARNRGITQFELTSSVRRLEDLYVSTVDRHARRQGA